MLNNFCLLYKSQSFFYNYHNKKYDYIFTCNYKLYVLIKVK